MRLTFRLMLTESYKDFTWLHFSTVRFRYTDIYIYLTRSLPLTSILVIQYMFLSRTPAPQDITIWHLGKTKSYPGMALREKLAWQRTWRTFILNTPLSP